MELIFYDDEPILLTAEQYEYFLQRLGEKQMGILDNILKQHKLDPEEFDVPKDAKRIKGKIIKVNSEKGWGFIVSDEMKFTRFFFRWSALAPVHIKDVKKGNSVEFTPVDFGKDKGWWALKIKVIE